MQAQLSSAKKSRSRIQQAHRPAQIVITMSDDMKSVLMAKAKADRLPISQVARVLLQSWAGAAVLEMAFHRNIPG